MSTQPKPEPQKPDMVLRAFYLHHNETYAPGLPGVSTALGHWDRDKHGGPGQLVCEERQNGDVWLLHPRGYRIEISALVISHKVRGPEKLPGAEAVRRG